MKPPLRTKSVGTKVSEEEFAALESRAQAWKLTLSEWVRAELLESKTDSGVAHQISTGTDVVPHLSGFPHRILGRKSFIMNDISIS